MACDHELFVRRNDIHGDAAVSRRYAGTVRCICLFVELDPKPGGVAANTFPDEVRVFANPGGED